MIRASGVLVCLLIFLFVMAGCATVFTEKERNPVALLNNACRPGMDVRSVKGSVWMKASSREASGQFPADVEVNPTELRLEVTNLLGATEAVIRVNKDRYSVQTERKNGGARQGRDSWGGIPLAWSRDLFLGRIPCPPVTSWKSASLSSTPDGELTVRLGRGRSAEKFVYHFKKWAGEPWPDSLHWEKGSPPVRSVDFKFENPEDLTFSPLKWEAKSAAGEVKVRWRGRDVSR